jgi:hypothetical protein
VLKFSLTRCDPKLFDGVKILFEIIPFKKVNHHCQGQRPPMQTAPKHLPFISFDRAMKGLAKIFLKSFLLFYIGSALHTEDVKLELSVEPASPQSASEIGIQGSRLRIPPKKSVVS